MRSGTPTRGVNSTVTLRDIAEALGVSHSSVSRALNNNPAISSSLRRQVQTAARQMGYRPNAMALALGQQRHSLPKPSINAELAWINFWGKPEQLRAYKEFELYWKGAYRAAEQWGYRLEEFNCNRDISPPRLESILLSRNIHGVLIPPHRVISQYASWDKIHWEKFSVVRIGYSVSIPSAHVVAGNHLTSGLLAFDNIKKRGYKRIGFVSSKFVTARFKAGFLMRHLDLEPSQQVPVLLLPCRKDGSPYFEPFLHWLKKYRPDALLTDIAAMRDLLEQAGFKVPHDIGLAVTSVLDGNADAGIYQNSEYIGEAAINTLVSSIHQNYHSIPHIFQEVLIESRWVNGKSLPPVRGCPSAARK